MVGENENDTEIITEEQEQEDDPNVDGTREEIVTKAEDDVQQAHTVDDKIKSQDPDSEESSTSQKLVTEADEGLENLKTQIETDSQIIIEPDEAEQELDLVEVTAEKDTNLEYKTFKISQFERESLELLLGKGGSGDYWKAIEVLKNIVGDGYFFPINATLVYRENKDEIVKFDLNIINGNIITIEVDFNDIENEKVGIAITEFENIENKLETDLETIIDDSSVENSSDEKEPGIAEQLEEVLVTAQEEIEKEREERREKWEIEDDKEGVIEEEKNTIKGGLEKRLTEENQNLLEVETPESEGPENQDISEQRNVQEILKSYEKIKDLRNSLEAEVNQEMTKREEISNSIQASLTPENADLSQLNSIERDMLKKSTNDILKTTKNVLSMKEIDYLMETMGPENNFGDLKGTHENRKIEMDKLQDTINALEKFKELVEEFETLNERTLAEQREEVTETVAGLEHIQKNNKKLFAALVAIGVVAGVVALCLTTGTPLPAFLTAKNVIIAGGAIAAVGTLAYLYKKDKLPSLKQMGEAAEFATGLSLAGGFLALDSLFNGEKVDKAFKFLCGTGLPSWAEDSKKS